MTMYVKVPLSEKTYRRVKKWADTRHQDVAETIAEHLEQPLPLAEEDFAEKFPQTDSDENVEKERNAFLALHPDLLQNYPDEFVAIQGEQLVDHDANKSALYARINQLYPEQFVLVRRVIAEPEPTYQFHATRLD
ncbi:MAG TPA: hypothetical protein PK530_23795 [Anaerolineales bacterium]|nr:hypothetical protein [Anaerolineales bacterium]